MTTVSLLPVLQRELRVASRRKINYWSRVIAAGSALFVALSILAVMEITSTGFPQPPGSIVFSVLRMLSFAFVSAAGMFLTSDSLSEEKRDGTMGLLFLTDLRGYDVVLGKLGATSLRAAYGLLAAFPILAVGFLLGGVTASEFWRLILVLCNTLFVSLTVGMFVSSISRDAQKAMGGTLLLLAALFFVPWGLDWWLANWSSPNYVARYGIASPLWAFLETSSRTNQFWRGLALTHGLGWLLLGVTSLLSARNWQEKVIAHKTDSEPWRVPARIRPFSKRDYLSINPVFWLGGKRNWLASVSRWVVLIFVVAFFLFSFPYSPGKMSVGMALSFVGSAIMILAVASQASSFFVEVKRTGMLELMLVTPLTVREIIAGHARALRRMFLFPALMLLAMMAVSSALQLIQVYTSMSGGTPSASGGFTSFSFVAMQLIHYLRSLIGFLTGLLAVAWFGMWMGLTTSKTHFALIKTLVFVQVLPWFALIFIQPFTMLLMIRSANLMWVSTLLTALLALGVDIAFIIVSYGKVHQHLREWAGQDGTAVRSQKSEVPRQESVKE